MAIQAEDGQNLTDESGVALLAENEVPDTTAPTAPIMLLGVG